MKLFNSATVTVSAGLVRRGGGLARAALTVRYGLIDRGRDGLCLVDTGYGPRVTGGPRGAALRIYNAILRPLLVEDQSPARVLEAIGARADDVRAIVVTHLHADHVAGLLDFPRARLIAHGGAARAMLASSERTALRHGVFRELLPDNFASRIEAVEARATCDTATVAGRGHDIFGDGSYLAIPLPGHANGHFGLFWREDGRATLYAVDAAWSTRALVEDLTPGFSRAAVFDDGDAGRGSERLLRAFIEEGGDVRLCHEEEPG